MGTVPTAPLTIHEKILRPPFHSTSEDSDPIDGLGVHYATEDNVMCQGWG